MLLENASEFAVTLKPKRDRQPNHRRLGDGTTNSKGICCPEGDDFRAGDSSSRYSLLMAR